MEHTLFAGNGCFALLAMTRCPELAGTLYRSNKLEEHDHAVG